MIATDEPHAGHAKANRPGERYPRTWRLGRGNMNISHWMTRLVAGLVLCVLMAGAAIWFAGDLLIHPVPANVGPPPIDLPARAVVFGSNSGSMIHGWFVPGRGIGAVLLLHGVRANRLGMLDRARFLHRAGYAVLLIDFQASGESPGRVITFGYLESRDAQAAVAELRKLAPGQPIGLIGTSMGGAAALLAQPRLEVDAMVLEQVYPTLAQALDDRLRLYAGVVGTWLEPLLAMTVKPHLGLSLQQMRPIDRIRALGVPKLLVAGSADRRTTLGESLAMYRATASPKQLWVVPGARHVDLDRYAGPAYRAHILSFFATWLRHDGERVTRHQG
ncbi:alpha/beta hydrolase [Dyella ginsengisoli]|uniref:alpha/beta hydrolase n=1 Tax=Dyella ginsengisoli TaxID=363848 RepID=UPI00034AEC8C|nr:alpha/beta fold hydrolase [Dyella ginsengisoli]